MDELFLTAIDVTPEQNLNSLTFYLKIKFEQSNSIKYSDLFRVY